MATFYYAKGDPVKNAEGYRLLKKQSDGSYSEVKTQQIKQQLIIPGAIGLNGSPAEFLTICNQGISASVIPITKLTTNGYVYYIKVSGLMDVITEDSHLVDVPFEGTLNTLTSYAAVDFVANGLKYSNGYIYLTTNLGDIQVSYVDLGDSIVSSLQIVDGIVNVYSAQIPYYRTDFISIDSLTDHLRDPDSADPSNPMYYCAGPFKDDANALSGYKIAFYSGMSYSTFIKGLDWDDFQETFLSVEFLQDLVAEYATNAKYVMFCSSTTNYSHFEDTDYEGKDFVSLGGINFLLDGYTPASGDKFVVQAIGDGKFFADSDYSNEIPEG